MEIPRHLAWPAVALAIYAALCYLASRSVYYPFRFPAGQWDLQAGAGAQDVWLETSDRVKIHAWWIARPEARFTTLHLHGNGGNITHRVEIAREILSAGSSVLLLDYRGYGRSEGRPSEAGLYRDADAAYAYLAARTPPDRIVIHGESLGSAVAVDLALRKPCAGLVLEAPFPSVRAVARRVLPGLGPLLIWGFDSKTKIKSLRVPLLVVHGDRDEVIDYSLGRELYEAAPEPKQFWTIAGASHNDIVCAAGDAYRARLAAFYESLAPSGSSALP
jgi:fermentation-respiration switch protein FrsA (DUF1100 family)